MNLVAKIKSALTGAHHHGCGCQHHDSTASASRITKDMIVKDVTARWPQTVAVFGNHKVDFCCGGAHSIEQTARARGCQDVDKLVADLNQALAAG
jgi:hypothetical protein